MNHFLRQKVARIRTVLAPYGRAPDLEEIVREMINLGWRDPTEKTEPQQYREATAYGEDDLIYAARWRCKCGSGMATLRNGEKPLLWACSAQLKHEAGDTYVLICRGFEPVERNDRRHTLGVLEPVLVTATELDKHAGGATTRPPPVTNE
jgi:hypothetical protein